MAKQQKPQQQALQTVQDQNNEKLTLLGDEICLTQESVERIKEDTYTHISYMLECIYTLEDAFRWYQFESDTATFFSLHNFIYHKFVHCTHTLKLFVPHFTLIETISFQ